MHIFHFTACAIFTLCCSNCFANKAVLEVSTQTDFDNISYNIKKTIQKGYNDVVVSFKNKTFFFHEHQLDLSHIEASHTNLVIDGNGAIFIPKENLNKQKPPYQLYYYENDLAKHQWSDLVSEKELIEIHDIKNEICRIPNNGMDVQAGDYIQVTQWYKSEIYKINDVTNDSIFFHVPNLTYLESMNSWFVNTDYAYGECFPRTRFFRTNENKYQKSSDVCNLINISNTRFKKIDVKKLKVIGNSYTEQSAAICINDAKCLEICLNNLSFSNTKSSCISIKGSNNVKVKNCSFKDCEYTCITTDNFTNQTVIHECKFKNTLKALTNISCIRLESSDFIVSNNIFEDFGDSAISFGVWYGNPKMNPVSGIIECNNIFYTRTYSQDFEKHSLMDTGAIYAFTQTDNVVIRHNKINNIAGMKDNRGIFCDDGAKNIEIYGNVIYDIHNYWSIDSRNCPNVEMNPRNKGGVLNINNILENNIISTPIRFVGRFGDIENGCEVSDNYFLAAGDVLLNRINNTKTENNKIIRLYKTEIEKIYIDKEMFREIEKNPYFSKIKRWVSKID